MERALAIKGRGRVSREEIIKIQEEASRKAMTVRRVRTGVPIAADVPVSLFALLPLLCAVSVAFTPSGELFIIEMSPVPRQPTLGNFRQALMRIPLVRFVCNSFITAGLITVEQIISCPLTALSLSFLKSKGENAFFMLVMITMMISGEATIISNYPTASQRNWLDSYQVLTVPHLTSAMGVFLFRQFYKSFPTSPYESTKIDGCGNLRFTFCTLFPLTKSVIGTMAVYTFINTWSMYMWPLLVIGSNEMRAVQIGISMLNSADAQSVTLMIAGMVMIILLSTSIFILGQKQLMWSMFSGAIKG